MTSTDKINEIKNYIEKYKNDTDGSWENQHDQYLELALNRLNKAESKQFGIEIWKWNQFQLYKISDPIIFCSNKWIDDFLYIKIVSIITNLDYLDYLVENVIHYIRPPYYSTDDIKDWDYELIVNLEKNITKVSELKNQGWKKTLEEVIKFLNAEIEIRKNNYS